MEATGGYSAMGQGEGSRESWWLRLLMPWVLGGFQQQVCDGSNVTGLVGRRYHGCQRGSINKLRLRRRRRRASSSTTGDHTGRGREGDAGSTPSCTPCAAIYNTRPTPHPGELVGGSEGFAPGTAVQGTRAYGLAVTKVTVLRRTRGCAGVIDSPPGRPGHWSEHVMKPSAKKKNCTKFEPQTWRPNRCKNCFKSPAQHPDAEAEDANPEATDAPAAAAKVSEPAPASAKPTADGGKKAKVAGERATSPGEPAGQPAPAPDGNTPGQDKNTPGSAGSEPPPQPASDSKPDHKAPDQGMRSQPSAPVRPNTISYVASHSPNNFEGPGAEAEGNGPASSPRGSAATLEATSNGADWAGAGPNTLADISRSQVSPATPPESPSDGTPQDPNRTRSFHLIRRQRSVEGDEGGRRRRRRRESMDDVYADMSREDALAEGTRLMLETLRDKLGVMEERCERLEREKAALGDLLAVRKAEFNERDLEHRGRLEQLEDKVIRLSAENDRLQDRLKLPESERHNLRDQENEIVDLRDKLEVAECRVQQVSEDNTGLQQEIQDLHLEMEEMHDQFRDDEALEFRELQKELEATAKNCRILQFKLRKADRRNELIESERVQYEEKIRQLERRFECDDKGPMKELEEELRMAKEVSVRLHDELEMVEERRIKAEEELARVQDYLRESESRRLALQQEAETLGDEVRQ